MGEPLSLNWLDLAIVLIITGSAGISLFRGFGREVLSLINFFSAFVIARLFSPYFSGLLMNMVQHPIIRTITAHSLLFFVSLIVGGLIARSVSLLIKVGGLEMADRLVGSGFGFARGLIIVVVLVGTLNWGGWFINTRVWQESNLVPFVLPIEQWSRELARSLMFFLDADGLSDGLMWPADSFQNNPNGQYQQPDDASNRVLQMLGPK